MHLKEFERKSTVSHWIKQAQLGLVSQEEEIRWRATITPSWCFFTSSWPYSIWKTPPLPNRRPFCPLTYPRNSLGLQDPNLFGGCDKSESSLIFANLRLTSSLSLSASFFLYFQTGHRQNYLEGSQGILLPLSFAPWMGSLANKLVKNYIQVSQISHVEWVGCTENQKLKVRPLAHALSLSLFLMWTPHTIRSRRHFSIETDFSGPR